MEPVKKDFIIKGHQIYLRPITGQDTDLALKWRNKKEVVDNFIYRKPITREVHTDWLRNKVFKGLVHQFIICLNDGDIPVGSTYLQNFEEEHQKTEWGIYIGEDIAYGKGIGTETAGLMIKYAFDELGMHKVTARVLAYNKASIRIHEKAGFVKEAHLKEELFLDGHFEDLLLYGIIRK